MCLHHTQTRTRMRARTHTHTGAHLHLLALLPSSDSDLSGCCSSILHTQHFPLLPLQSVPMSYEGDERGRRGSVRVGGVRFWGWRKMLRHQNVPQLTSVSDAPPLCMCNAQTETCSRGVRGHLRSLCIQACACLTAGSPLSWMCMETWNRKSLLTVFSR